MPGNNPTELHGDRLSIAGRTFLASLGRLRQLRLFYSLFDSLNGMSCESIPGQILSRLAARQADWLAVVSDTVGSCAFRDDDAPGSV